MDANILETRAGRFFWKVTAWPKTILVLALLLVVGTAAFLPRLTKDTRSDAFIPADDPSLVYRDKVKEIFGLADPMVIAVINEGPDGVFNPHSLQLVSWLSERTSELPGVDPDRITSLATENDIIGTEDGMIVEPFFEEPPSTQEEAEKVREAVMDFPLYLGSLVARDGRATLIVVELLDQKDGEEVYSQLLALAEEAPVDGEEIHIAGEGAVSGYLGAYIDSDAMRLNPVAFLLISAVLFVAYRTLRGVLLPNFVVIGALAVGLGTMAAVGVPFYPITNALVILLIGISVADTIHVLAQYYEEMALRPTASPRVLAARSMVEMWRPVTFTSLTDVAGLMGLSLASLMPPMRMFGLFASVGVFAALLLSLFAVPAALVLLRPKPSKAFRPSVGSGALAGADRFGRALSWLGRGVVQRPGWILAVTGVVLVAGLLGASQLEVNEERIQNFQSDEPIYKADRAINRTLDGTNYLDVVVETPEPEDLFKPENLRRIEAMQEYFETLPHVKGTTSIVDYLKQMNRAVNEDQQEEYRLPDDADLVAQYFLLYSASGDPTDFEEEIDYDYQLANVRVTMDTGLYTDEKVVVEAAERYIREEFNAPGITAHLAGRVNVDYHWIKALGPGHFLGVALALVAVWLMAALSFRSLVAGSLTVVPVSMAVLLVYAVMGSSGIYLGIGTSMFAAIAIGTSVDFAVHMLDRLIALMRHQGQSLEQAFAALFPSTGRALLFNFIAVFLGFGVFVISKMPPLFKYGLLIALGVLVSFVVTLTVLPALVKVLRPAFLGFKPSAVHIPESRELQPSEAD